MAITVCEKKYTKEHEWIELSDDQKEGILPVPHLQRSTFITSKTQCSYKANNKLTPSPSPTGTIGITHYAASSLGDVVYVELPALDLEVSAGDSIGAVESVKSASDIMTPVSGKIIATNEKLEEKPGTINKGPEGEGWIARIQVGDAKEVEGLLGLEEYRKLVEE
ncbi:MAG: hypothetical protein L6R39_001584 [Caloplaca ligustica]|nr:MAG: hypothetical protein L6R39_001584 [Caloplaca ligustica]